jgi:8-oxo-dGTP diphosphatase
MFHVYSDPSRDPRMHTITTVFTASCKGVLQAGDDAGSAGVFAENELPGDIAFDHSRIIADYFSWKRGERKGMTCR